MQRIRASLVTLITLIIPAIATHLVWVAIAPTVPYAIVSLVAIGVLGALYYRKRPGEVVRLELK